MDMYSEDRVRFMSAVLILSACGSARLTAAPQPVATLPTTD